MRLIAISCCFFVLARAANASPVTLETVTITAQKATAASFNIEAESKNEFYAEELRERGMYRLQDISKNIANFNITDQSLGSFRQMFTMRGLTNTSIFSAPAVVFYVDDVAYGSPMSNMGQLFDIASLSVYRSSQPGRFGKNAYAGAVDIQTRQPGNRFENSIGLELGSYGYHAVNVKSAGALIKDQLYFNLSGVYNERDGFLYNSFLNNHPDAQENYSGRAALTWQPSSALDIRLTLTKDDFDYGNARFTRLDRPNSFTTEAGMNEQLQQNADSQTLRIVRQTESYKLLSISSHRFWQMSPLRIDLDLKPPPIASRNLTNDEETWTQEVRLSPKRQGLWDWQAGVYFSSSQFHEVDNILITDYLDVYRTEKQTENYAVFGRLAYQGFTDLNLYTELHLDYVSSHLVSSLNSLPGDFFLPVTLSYDTFFASPKWGVDYRLSEHSLTYAATGFSFKPGGLTFANIEPRAIQFDKETLWYNTVGIKNDWFNERLKTHIAAFYYDISDYQVERFFAGGNYSAFNVPKVSSYGVEFEGRLRIIDNLALENSVGYTHIRFDDYHDLITGVDYTGNTVPFVPEFNALAALQYKHPQGYFARAEWLWKGNTYFDETNLLHQSAYSIVNLRIGYAKEHYDAYVYVNNLTDTYFYTTQLGVRGAPGDPAMAGARLSLHY